MADFRSETSDKVVPTLYSPTERDERGRLLKGFTANPNGRPKGAKSASTLLREVLAQGVGADPSSGLTLCHEFVQTVVQGALDVNHPRHLDYAKLVLAYTEGLPKATQEVTLGIVPQIVVAEVIAQKYTPKGQ